jgi:hypothetical protein
VDAVLSRTARRRDRSLFGRRGELMRTTFILLTCISFIGCSADKPRVRPSDRSWATGTITVAPTYANGELGVDVDARWPDCGEGLWIRYELCLAQSGSPDVFLVGGTTRLIDFQTMGTGVSDYSQGTEFIRDIDRKKPYKAVFDYEIWKGKPTKGELLAKNFVSSSEIAARPPQ